MVAAQQPLRHYYNFGKGPLELLTYNFSHTANSVMYSNRVLEIFSDINVIVTREKCVEISFSCQYSKSGVVSSLGWKPENNVVIYNDGTRELHDDFRCVSNQ